MNSFDPFAAAPAPSASPESASFPASNPFDSFAPNPPNGRSNDRQRSARSVMSNGSKFLSANKTTTSSAPPSLGTPNHRRVVPYKGPIATLQSSWDPTLAIACSSAPQSLWTNNGNGSSTYLLVKLNTSACVSGASVESVLKWNKLQQKNNNSMTQELGGFDTLTLAEGDVSAAPSPTSSSYASSDQYPGKQLGGAKKVGVGGFLKNLSSKANTAIANSVTQIAIKADKGRNPDEVCSSLHYCSGHNISAVNAAMGSALHIYEASHLRDVCLSKTEWMPLPSSVSGAVDANRGVDESEGLFNLPLHLPDLNFLSSCAAGSNGPGVPGNENGVRLVIRLYIRSSAAFLKAVANTGLKREYCVGEAVVLLESILHLVNRGVESNATGFGTTVGGFSLPFTAGMLADPAFTASDLGGDGNSPAALKLLATTRIKFNSPCSLGWTLCESVSSFPDKSQSMNWVRMFNMPLDQGYVFPIAHHHYLLGKNCNASSLLLCNERAVESTVVLPLATACSRLFSASVTKSKQLATMAALKNRRREAVYLPEDESKSRLIEAALREGCAEVEIGIVALVMLGESDGAPYLSVCGIPGTESIPTVSTSLSFQPPNCIFEEGLGRGSLPLLDETAGRAYVQNSEGTGPKEAVTVTFCPRILTGMDDLLPGVAGTRPNGKYVGSVRFEVKTTSYESGIVDTIGSTMMGGTSVEGTINLDSYIDTTMSSHEKSPVMVPAIDANSGRRLGTFVVLLRVKNLLIDNHVQEMSDASSAAGLVSVVGLDTLTEELGLGPFVDSDAPPSSASDDATGVRRRQVATMGSFLTTRYLNRHTSEDRSKDASTFSERYSHYSSSIKSAFSPDVTVENDENVELCHRRLPRAFRPSSSRGNDSLTGIPFNVHVQSLALSVITEGQPSRPVGVTSSVTHGAPADHSRGFGVALHGEDAKEENAPKGGLRRLESKRIEIAKELEETVNCLIGAVGDHFKSRAQIAAARQQAGAKNSRHIPPNLPSIIHHRKKAIECAQRLHSLTWEVAVRRANCFSQALGIAVTSFLASISDGGPAWRGYADVWAKHGFLLTFEGLLSAVGKELGMIEDAAVAIAMLRMVNVVLVSDSHVPTNECSAPQRIPVPHSPYVRWVHLIYVTPHGSHSKTQYRLEIGMDPSYYLSRVPEPLKNGTAVRFFPILFQMGVDFRQWGANAGRDVQRQLKDKAANKSAGDLQAEQQLQTADSDEMGELTGNCSLLDDGDEDDDGGVADNEILFNLNVEGYRKLNSYAHSVQPASATINGTAPLFELSQSQPLPLHPSMIMLSEAIKSSASRMEHSVLDRAASLTQNLGGGSTVFCKSGKDRTASEFTEIGNVTLYGALTLHIFAHYENKVEVTFKQAQYVQRFLDRRSQNTALEDTHVSNENVFAKSTLMRIHGNRIPVCEKNAGEVRYPRHCEIIN